MKRGLIGYMLVGYAASALAGPLGIALAIGALLVISGAVDTIRQEVRR